MDNENKWEYDYSSQDKTKAEIPVIPMWAAAA